MYLVESCVQRLGAVGGLATLTLALAAMLRSLKRLVGKETGQARRVLRFPYLAMATVGFLGVGVLLWRALPLELETTARLAATICGALLFFPSLAFYLWGMLSLGAMFGPASGFGVRLFSDHRLVTSGPFALIRHPMYTAAIFAGMGGLCIYRTWSMLAFSIILFGLVFRASREEEALAAQFGEEWQAYASRVPRWIPRLWRRGKRAG